jgi:hypothetical protein
MSKYRKEFLISVVSVVLTLSGFCFRGTHHAVRLASRPINTVGAPAMPAPIELGPGRIVPRPQQSRQILVGESSDSDSRELLFDIVKSVPGAGKSRVRIKSIPNQKAEHHNGYQL